MKWYRNVVKDKVSLLLHFYNQNSKDNYIILKDKNIVESMFLSFFNGYLINIKKYIVYDVHIVYIVYIDIVEFPGK